MEHTLLKSLLIITGASALVVFVLHRLKVPSIVGFLVAGVIIGPYGVGVVRDTKAVEMMAEVGVILLLFTIGIEFSIARLARMKKAVLGGGGMQVLLTIAASAAAAHLAGVRLNTAVFFGFLAALSSTAIVMKLLADSGETDSPHGRVMIGILIFQDLCVVPLMLVSPALAGEGLRVVDILRPLAQAAGIVAVVLLAARWAVPLLLHQVVGTRSRELFITTIILICFGIAYLTSSVGLSLALGAFLAGLVISESEYAHQATADILPFKESFIGFFFVSVGMLMDLGYMTSHCLTIAGAVALIFAIKTAAAVGAVLLIGTSLRTSLHAGLGLAQVGEFSFVLAAEGKGSGLLPGDAYQLFLAASVVTMILTPFVLRVAPGVSAWLTSRTVLRRALHLKRAEAEGSPRKRQGHVVIIGFGLNGRNLARVLKEADIPYVVLEMNSDTVQQMKKKGEPIYYGDGTSAEILHRLSIDKARLLVVAISDPVSTRRMVAIARHENPDLYIIVRTRYLIEVEELQALGANEVIPEEFETSIEIFTRVLARYNFPRGIITDMADLVRSGGYTALRMTEVPRGQLFEKCEWLPELELDGFRVPEGSHLEDRSITELQVRKKTGATIIAVRRGQEVVPNPPPEFRFRPRDIVLLTGDREAMDRALQFFRG